MSKRKHDPPDLGVVEERGGAGVVAVEAEAEV
jgi:hypothetical protein